MSRRKVGAAIAAAGLVLLITPVVVWAQVENFTGFYNLRAEASGMSVIFGNPSTQPYPTAAGQVPETQATLSNGPAAYALSTVAWPGPLLANAGGLSNVLFPLCVPDGDGVCLPKPDDNTRDMANYPVRAEAFAPGGQSEDEIGPLSARAVGDDALAKATAANFDSGGIVSAGRVTTTSHSFLDIGRGTSIAETVGTDLELAGGVVKIKSLRTYAKASTDGTRTVVDRDTVVQGLEINGQAATVDEEGVRFTDEAADPLNEELLSNFGMEIFLTRPVTETTDEGEARLHTGSLAILWDLGDSGNHVLVTIGGAFVHVQGSGALAPPSTDVPGDLGPFAPPAQPEVAGASDVNAGSDTILPPAAAPSAGGRMSADVVLPNTEQVASFAGIAPGWFVVGLLGVFLAGFGLNRMRGAALTRDPELAITCALENR